MRRLWAFLKVKRNREILGWLGGGAVVVIAGLWTAVTFFGGSSGGGGSGDRIDCTIQQNQGTAACRDVIIGNKP